MIKNPKKKINIFTSGFNSILICVIYYVDNRFFDSVFYYRKSAFKYIKQIDRIKFSKTKQLYNMPECRN